MIPVRTQILCKPFPSDEISEGGIIVPLSARKTSNKMKIIKVGKGTPKKPMKLKPGQTGFRVRDWGCPVVIEGDLHFLMDQDAILAIE